MNIVKALLCLTGSCLFMALLQSAPEPSASELRARAESILKTQQEKESQQNYYKNLKTKTPVQAYVDAAKIYQDLLTRFDDDQSREDLLALYFTSKKAWRYHSDTSEDSINPYKVITATLDKHRKNARYMWTVWQFTEKNRDFDFLPWAPKNCIELLNDTYYWRQNEQRTRVSFLLRLKIGEEVLSLAPGNMLPDEHAAFLLTYAGAYCMEFTNSAHLPAYGFLHQKTNLETIPPSDPQFQNPKDFRLLDNKGTPLSYSTPESWKSAQNDGERINYLLNEILTKHKNFELPARTIKVALLLKAFSPATALGLSLKRDENESYYYAQKMVTNPEFCRMILSLKDNETIVYKEEKFQKITLPPAFNYLAELKSLSYRISTPLGEDNQSKETKQDNICIIHGEVSNAYVQELIYRLKYEEAREQARILEKFLSLNQELQQSLNSEVTRQITMLAHTFHDLSSPSIDFCHNQSIPPTDSKVVRIPVIHRNADKAEVTLRKVNPSKFLKFIKKRADNSPNLEKVEEVLTGYQSYKFKEEENPEHESPETYNNLPSFEDVFDSPITLTYPLQPAPEKRDSFDILQLPNLESGTYRLEISTGENGNSCTEYIHISGIKIATFFTNEGLGIHVMDKGTEKPRANATISLIQAYCPLAENKSKQSVSTQEFTLKTDERGLAFIPMKREEQDIKPSYFFFLNVISENDSSFAFSERIISKKTNKNYKENESAAIVTDRPIYRPGQTVYWTAWTGKTILNGNGTPLINQRIKVSYGELKKEEILTTDDRGMLSGSFIIPGNAKLKSHQIKLRKENETDEYSYLASANVYMEEYKKQEVTVDLKTSKTYYAYGEKAKVTLTARYYSGEPVTEGEVKIRVDKPQFYDERSTEFIPEKTVSLNAQGEAVLEFDLPKAPEQKEDKTHRLPRKSEHAYTVTTVTTDASLRQIPRKTVFYVIEKPFKASVYVMQSYGKSGGNMSAVLNFSTADGKRLAAQGEATLALVTHNPEDEKNPHKKIVHTWPISTDKDGEFILKFTPPSAGRYELKATFPVNDQKTVFIDTSSSFYVLPARPDEAIPEFPPVDRPKIIAKNLSLKKGNPAKVLIITPPGIESVLLVRSQDYDDEEMRIINTPSRLIETVWETEEKHEPNFHISIPNQAGRYYGDLYFSIKKEKHELTLSPELPSGNETPTQTTEKQDQDQAQKEKKKNAPLGVFQPGESTQLRVLVKKMDGTPATNTPVVITIYDKALEDFHTGNFSSLKWSSFWNHSRHGNSNSDYYSSFQPIPTRTQGSHMNPLMAWCMAYAYVTNESTLEIDYSAVLHPLQDSKPHAFPKKTKHLAGLQSSVSSSARFGPKIGLSNSTIDDFYLSSNGKNFSGEIVTSEKIQGTGSLTSFAGAAEPIIAMGGNLSSGSGRATGARLKQEASLVEDQSKTAPPSKREQEEMLSPLKIRKQFSDLLKWSGTLITDEDGMVTLPITMPDNLTSWRILAGAVDQTLNSGYLSAEFQTSQHLIAQLHTPRFLVAGDKSLLTSIIRNNTDKDEVVEVSLSIHGDSLKFIEEDKYPIQRTVTVPAKGSVSVDWSTEAIRNENVLLTLTAKGSTLQDAAQYSMPLIIRGAYNSVAQSSSLLPGIKQGDLSFTIPKKADHSLSQLDINVSPGVAPVVIRALPFLSDYPYGCVEQSLNKFLPTIIVRNTLKDLNVDLTQIPEKDPALKKDPLRDPAVLEKQIQAGMEKIVTGHNKDGGWGWFGGGDSSPHITAQVVHGLLILNPEKDESSDYTPYKMLKAGLRYLKKHETNRIAYIQGDKDRLSKSLDAFIHTVLIESGDETLPSPDMLAFLVRDRHHLSAYPLAQLALILHQKGQTDTSQDILKALKGITKTDPQRQTAWLDLPSTRFWWDWDQDDIESQAAYLKLLCAVSPKDPLTRELAKWLAENRENSFYWKSTRDTALAIEALCTYMKASGEGTKPLTVKVLLNEKEIKTISYSPSELISFNGDLVIDSSLLGEGTQKLSVLRASGDEDTPVYFSAGLKYFSLEDKLTASGTDLKINRKIARVTTEKTESGILKENKVPLADEEKLKSGDIIEVSLEIESKNDYQYLMIRDPKPAGCEPYQLISGYHAQAEVQNRGYFRPSYYTELADKETRIFAESLPRGKNTITYKLRVERPGTYTALPTQIEAMYTPILRGNSNEAILTIQKQPDK